MSSREKDSREKVQKAQKKTLNENDLLAPFCG